MHKLAIVVGHTNKDKGAYSPYLGASEYVWNSDLAKKISEVLSSHLVVKTFFRDVGGIAGAYARGDSWGAEAFVELHFNSSHNNSSTGTGILYQTPHSKPLAAAMFKRISAALELPAWPKSTGGSVRLIKPQARKSVVKTH